ncbi:MULTISPECIES: SGNH/GDSL hydrolase family protein [Amycolatopsis]|uniref:Hydrolase n=1 Tax=Amycolatopsis bullii TaxID=941987 RepID=A0ABQ3KJI4_9PSEU|nr:SGNH/GDSL hydrolase family protein [Amycolatopsis bullii]GHG30144.1 hydrolase [Amycolatopsis bullii]
MVAALTTTFTAAGASLGSLSNSLRYVALGDSYASGEGVSPYFDPNNSCHRSKQAYSTRVQIPFSGGATFYATRSQTDHGWGFLACSGATTDDVTARQLDNQVDRGNSNNLRLSSATTFVTLTVGGDNLGFANVLTFCAWDHSNCQNDPYSGRRSLADWMNSQLSALHSRLVALYRNVRAHAPNARLIVTGYPQIFPASDHEQNCAWLREYWTPGAVIGNRYFPGPTIGFSHNEQNYLRSVDSRLNDVIASAARDSGVAEFVGVAGTFAGHEVCGDRGQWIAEPSLELTSNPPFVKVASRSFHPTATGQSQYAAAINNYTTPSF